MRATIEQSENNDRYLTITMTGYGHWKIECTYRGKRISTITTNARAIDDFNSDFCEKYERRNRRKEGYQDLINEIITSNTDRYPY